MDIAFLTIAETTKPTLRVTSPANNFISTSSSVTLRGTAGDTLGVSSVQLLVNSNSLQTAAGTTSWSATVALAPGANHVKVQSYNLSDLASTPVNLTLIYIVTSPLTLQINGSGKIIGAIGCSGGTGSQDEAICMAASATINKTQ